MARRCICSRLLANLQEDPRLRTLPLATRMLWLLLAEAMARPGFEGVLPFSDPRRVSLLVSESQTETETHLETLIGEGLIQREGEMLVCPLLREAAARTLAARRNGARGGRPRRNETAEEMHQRRQREMLLPVPGGGAEKPSETQAWETPSAGAALRGPTTSKSSDSDSVVSREGGWVQLAKDAIAEGRLTHPRLAFTPARDWLAMGTELGLDEGEVRRIVLGVVRRTMDRGAKGPGDIKSLGYFTPAIERVMKGEEELADPVGEEPAPRHVPGEYEIRFNAWMDGGCQGPPPTRRAA